MQAHSVTSGGATLACYTTLPRPWHRTPVFWVHHTAPTCQHSEPR